MFALGLVSSGATLATRILGSSGYYITNTRDPFGGYPLAFRLPLDADLPYDVAPWFGAFPTWPFPYGLPVDPDVPM